MKEYLFVVEGVDDEDFFRTALIPELKRIHSDVNFSVSVSSSWKAENYRRQFDIYHQVFIVRDLDDAGCPLRKKNIFCTDFNLHNHKDSICIVIAEIESWYVAVGSSSERARRLPKAYTNRSSSTESIRKEDLERAIRRASRNVRVDAFMRQMITTPDFQTGLMRNSSLKYLFTKVASRTGTQ